jgi:hypothetical protein
MARILHGTGEYERDYRKRFVDQGVLVATMQQRGFDPGPGRDALRRMNGIHRRYPIERDDFVMIGCDTIVGPVRLAERYGWREVTAREKEALAHSSALMMNAMGLRDIPRTYQEQDAALDHYLDTRCAFSEDARPLGAATLDFFVGIEPEPVRSIMSEVLRSAIDPRIVRALGLEVPEPAVVALMQRYVTAVGQLDPVTDDTHPAILQQILAEYPHGVDIATVGVHRVDADTSTRPVVALPSGTSGRRSHSSPTSV